MTSDGQSLFRAVCENPCDDMPRLAFADWLDENGQPELAEFIRLQCEAWNLCPAYPTLSAARTRASLLLREFRDTWYEQMPAVEGVEWGNLFIRGFIDTARTVATRDIRRTLEGAFAGAPLQRLIVANLKPGQLGELLVCPLLARLVALKIPGTQGREEARLLGEARKRFAGTQID